MFIPALPIILKPPAEARAAQRDDRNGAGDGPVHAGALEACADGELASGFDNAGGRAQAFGFELG